MKNLSTSTSERKSNPEMPLPNRHDFTDMTHTFRRFCHLLANGGYTTVGVRSLAQVTDTDD